jgi:hypothetical protein
MAGQTRGREQHDSTCVRTHADARVGTHAVLDVAVLLDVQLRPRPARVLDRPGGFRLNIYM